MHSTLSNASVGIACACHSCRLIPVCPSALLSPLAPPTTGYSTCKVLSEGLTAAEASALKGGKIPSSLATRLELTPGFVGEASADLAKAAAGIKASPAKMG